MKHSTLLASLFGLLLVGCDQKRGTRTTAAAVQQAPRPLADKEQIQHLIRQVLRWGDSLQVGLLPGVVDTTKGVVSSLNLSKHQQDLAELRASGLFAAGFIDNYNRVILTLDKRLRSGKQHWLAGDPPDFGFYRGANAWCNCQDVPYDKPNPWDFVEIKLLNKSANTAEATWHWGKLPAESGPDWKNFSYKFSVVKENGKWKIAYLEGFDSTEALKPT